MNEKSPKGIAIVETAIILPVLLTMILLFANVMSMILTHQRIISAQIQQQINAQPKPLLVGMASTGASLVASISPLSTAGAEEYMKQLGDDLLGFLQNSGSFSSDSFAVALTLSYVFINPATGAPEDQPIQGPAVNPLIVKPPGGGGGSGTIEMIHWEQVGNPFFVLELNDSDPCFNPPDHNKQEQELSSFMRSKLTILSPDTYSKTIGLELYEVTKLGTVTKAYVTRKPIVFGLVCAKAGILPWQAPIVRPIMIFPNKDVGT